ncbi:CRISPR-associated protein, Cse1 family [Solidesulfovibrio carbinoliphilus subsp. oakridgensis]|uniref:CRISPR-associated protein, Cse1 family n=1 Tax=Solidesulfovibrio carbinoliphilus subsp. oakridgensis TaxID=694327 RepID=G7Q6E5_9BACT|nr:type I-E CRISPR-associated protein Cse1/CasA [Solidesulfovibrio carbinoliphilus]EHJ47318.1 CRISPR-associated protein, Cse1 family [Solidesulfovibrio carbinoliphilus subsp. oakridgensis]
MPSFNLLTQDWIPVRRVDGTRLRIPPWRITDPGDGSPGQAIADIDTPRPDFKGALLELLIGFVQTALPPTDNRKWRLGLSANTTNEPHLAPPDYAPAALKTAFAPLTPFFNLFGDRPRFLQDLTLTEAEAKEPSPIAALLMDSPGENATKFNSDFFIKRDQPPDRLCPACAAAALHALQTYAPSGGAGHRVSLRGGGPLTTLVMLDDSLWKTVWANVLPLDAANVEALPANPAALPGAVFPWLAVTRDSTAKGSEVHREGMHFLHHYWAMPRRIVLDAETDETPSACPVCGQPGNVFVRQYRTKNYGNNYGKGWQHPLTPYRDQGPGKEALTIKGESEGRAYNQWLGFVYGATDDKKPVIPARVVTHYRTGSPPGQETPARLRTFGWDMDNMKARNWCEGEYPILDLKGREAKRFIGEVAPLVKAAEEACNNLRKAVHEALFSEKGPKPKPDATLLALVETRFWAETETAFYTSVRSILEASDDDEEARLGIALGWRRTLLDAVGAIFAAVAEDGGTTPRKTRQIYAALNRMRGYTFGSCSKILGIATQKEAKS